MNSPTPGIYADAMLDKNKNEIQADFKLKHEELRKCRELFRDTIESLRAKELKTHSILWNAALHVNLAAEDISYLVEDLAFERNDWKRRMAARHFALAAFETAEDLQALLGKTLRDALDHVGVLAQFEKQLAEVRKPLQEFWGQHQKALKNIRITAAAHRDLDGIIFVKTIEEINIEDILTIGFELNNTLLGIGGAMKAILDETSRIQDPEQKAAADAIKTFQELAQDIVKGYPAFNEALTPFAVEIEQINANSGCHDSDYKSAFSKFNKKIEPICTRMEEVSTELRAMCETGHIPNMLANLELSEVEELRSAYANILKGTEQWKNNIQLLQSMLTVFRGPQSSIKTETDTLAHILGQFERANSDLNRTATKLQDLCGQ